MDYDTLPLFCKSGTRENSTTSSGTLDVFSPSHKFHTDLYNHIKQNALASGRSLGSLDSEGSLHIKVPTLEEQDPHSETAEVVHAIESVLPSLERQSNKDQKQRDKLTAKIAGIQVSTWFKHQVHSKASFPINLVEACVQVLQLTCSVGGGRCYPPLGSWRMTRQFIIAGYFSILNTKFLHKPVHATEWCHQVLRMIFTMHPWQWGSADVQSVSTVG